MVAGKFISHLLCAPRVPFEGRKVDLPVVSSMVARGNGHNAASRYREAIKRKKEGYIVDSELRLPGEHNLLLIHFHACLNCELI